MLRQTHRNAEGSQDLGSTQSGPQGCAQQPLLPAQLAHKRRSGIWRRLKAAVTFFSVAFSPSSTPIFSWLTPTPWKSSVTCNTLTWRCPLTPSHLTIPSIWSSFELPLLPADLTTTHPQDGQVHHPFKGGLASPPNLQDWVLHLATPLPPDLDFGKFLIALQTLTLKPFWAPPSLVHATCQRRGFVLRLFVFSPWFSVWPFPCY